MFVVSNDRSLPVKREPPILDVDLQGFETAPNRPKGGCSQLNARQLCPQCMPPEDCQIAGSLYAGRECYSKCAEEGRTQVMTLPVKNRSPYILFFPAPFFLLFFKQAPTTSFPLPLLYCPVHSVVSVLLCLETRTCSFLSRSPSPRTSRFFF